MPADMRGRKAAHVSGEKIYQAKHRR